MLDIQDVSLKDTTEFYEIRMIMNSVSPHIYLLLLMFNIQLSTKNDWKPLKFGLSLVQCQLVNSYDLHHNSSKYSPHIENQIGWKSSWKDQISCWLTMFSNRYPNTKIKKRKYILLNFLLPERYQSNFLSNRTQT